MTEEGKRQHMQQATQNTIKINGISVLVGVNTLLLTVLGYFLIEDRQRNDRLLHELSMRIQSMSDYHSKSDARLAVLEANHQMLMSLTLTDRRDRQEHRDTPE